MIVSVDGLTDFGMLKDSKLRLKISPDGQLILTTNLPHNASSYPYILASYPSAYYENKFFYKYNVFTLTNDDTFLATD